MKIRKVKAEDLWDVAKISYNSFRKSWSFPRFIEQYETNRENFLVAEEHGKVVGFSISDNSGLLMLIAVEPTCRKKGIGSKLLDTTLIFLKKKNVRKVFAHVRKSNENVIAFYLKHGFKKEKKLPHYYSDEDGWLLTKEL